MALKRKPLSDGVYSVTVDQVQGARAFASAWASIAIGFGLTAKRALGSKPQTIRYPYEKVELSPRWRGALRLRGALGRDEVPIVRGPSDVYNAVIDGLYKASRLAPCQGACPANVDPRGQNYLIAEDRTAEAYELVRERNILPGVLGRICHHPCEQSCRRNYYDEPIAIRPLHRFAYEEYDKVRMQRLSPLPITRQQKIAIVGSGPSGLAAGLDLMQLGYSVTTYEKETEPGGALQSGVPSYRLPREVLATEIDSLVRMGLELNCGVEIGKDLSLADLRERFDAVLIAAGLQTSRILPIPGADAKGVIGALPFLRDANRGRSAVARGKRVFVIGGGNVAVDVARCALRMGAIEVRLASLEGMDELPAHPWEIEEALDEGVIATCSVGPEEVLTDGSRVTGMRMRECLAVFDETGRFAPKFGENLTDFSCDVVVFSIGQASDLAGVVAGSDVELDQRGNLKVDGAVFTTTVPGVFACGEVVTGPGSCIGSIATGHEAATSIHRYLRSVALDADRTARPVPVYERYEPAHIEGVEESRRRVVMPMSPAEERVTDYRAVELGLLRSESMAEAVRCLRCQSEVCVGCTFCARTCPDHCITVERVDDPGARCLTRYELDLSKCCFCGLCAEQCPTNALAHTGQYELSFYHRDVMTFDKGEMLRDPGGTRATGLDGIYPPACPVPERGDQA
jgi:NADPH-dependent glutamate synthase beta subunit-like oxidoreductase/formate hydrogenlyase subunit 6/NADH:ubiquinone oxidoreductase subunit I